jgi:hypothetical protein
MTAGHDAPARLIVIFPGSAKVNLLGRGVFRSASRNWTCHPDLEKNDM